MCANDWSFDAYYNKCLALWRIFQRTNRIAHSQLQIVPLNSQVLQPANDAQLLIGVLSYNGTSWEGTKICLVRSPSLFYSSFQLSHFIFRMWCCHAPFNFLLDRHSVPERRCATERVVLRSIGNYNSWTFARARFPPVNEDAFLPLSNRLFLELRMKAHSLTGPVCSLSRYSREDAFSFPAAPFAHSTAPNSDSTFHRQLRLYVTFSSLLPSKQVAPTDFPPCAKSHLYRIPARQRETRSIKQMRKRWPRFRRAAAKSMSTTATYFIQLKVVDSPMNTPLGDPPMNPL